MNWDALGAIGEVGGAIAVVITLVYLSRQLSENTKSIKLQTLDSTFRDWNECLAEIQNTNGAGLAYSKALKAESLTDLEEHQLTYLFRRIFNLYAKVQYLKSVNAADPFNTESVESALPYLFQMEFFGKWWPIHRDRYAKTFRGYIDERIQNTD